MQQFAGTRHRFARQPRGEIGRQTGGDPARLAWDRLDEKSRVREKWVAIARAVVVVVREGDAGTRVPEPPSRSGEAPIDAR